MSAAEIPIPPAATSAPTSRGFIPWRPSNTGPRCRPRPRDGPASETLHNSGHDEVRDLSQTSPRPWLRGPWETSTSGGGPDLLTAADRRDTHLRPRLHLRNATLGCTQMMPGYPASAVDSGQSRGALWSSYELCARPPHIWFAINGEECLRGLLERQTPTAARSDEEASR